MRFCTDEEWAQFVGEARAAMDAAPHCLPRVFGATVDDRMALRRDMQIYGTSFVHDGRRVDPATVSFTDD